MEDLKNKPEEFWKQKLAPEEYRVLREKGTEPAFAGVYVDNHDEGVYRCRACGAELFSSATKFDSGTGWPSFTDPMLKEAVETRLDESHGMRRTEVVCKKCGGHLGHLFDDGPREMPNGAPATGMRYCINSCSLEFDPKES